MFELTVPPYLLLADAVIIVGVLVGLVLLVMGYRRLVPGTFTNFMTWIVVSGVILSTYKFLETFNNYTIGYDTELLIVQHLLHLFSDLALFKASLILYEFATVFGLHGRTVRG